MVKPAAPTSKSRPRKLQIVGGIAILIILVSLCIVGRFWHDENRPGMKLYQMGIDALAAHRADHAEAYWKEGTVRDPNFEPCFEQLGDLLVALNRPDEAVKYYADAAALSPNEGHLMVHLAKAQHAAGLEDESYISAKRAAQMLPNDADAVGGYGILEADRHNRVAARAALLHAHALRPDDVNILHFLTQVELDDLDFDAVASQLEPYLVKNPEDAQANYEMAVVYNEKTRSAENVHKALRYAQHAYPKMLNDPRIYSLLGGLYMSLNQVNDALTCYQAGIQALPNDTDLLHGLVLCYTRVGDRTKAGIAATLFQKATARKDRIEHLRTMLGQNKKGIGAALELARLREEDGDIRSAKQIYLQTLQMSPNDPVVKAAANAFHDRILSRQNKSTADRTPATHNPR